MIPNKDREFKHYFNIPDQFQDKFISMIGGKYSFDVIRFDQWLQTYHSYSTEKHGSTADFVKMKFGEEACKFLEDLLNPKETNLEVNMLNLKPISKKYYTTISQNIGWIEVKGRKVVIEGYEELDTFAHIPYDCKDKVWTISEGRLGTRLIGSAWETQKEAKAELKKRLDAYGKEEFLSTLEKALNSNYYLGLSPRYKAVENDSKD